MQNIDTVIMEVVALRGEQEETQTSRSFCACLAQLRDYYLLY